MALNSSRPDLPLMMPGAGKYRPPSGGRDEMLQAALQRFLRGGQVYGHLHGVCASVAVFRAVNGRSAGAIITGIRPLPSRWRWHSLKVVSLTLMTPMMCGLDA
ncbi:hypothetical protein KCP78_09880 [Salmonella enterica subsp. enterica]|nr:hypothetical protein KCP78_09880 [Salmonella enterica subsp. enterica]